jgi:NAD+ synthase (glutamine-hydrolysing)
VPLLRLALAQSNAVVGDLPGNAQRALEACRAAEQAGAHLVVLPEMFLTGYPIEDLALRASFVDAARHRMELLARTLRRIGLGHLTVIVGGLDRAAGRDESPGHPAGSPQNVAAVLRDGRIVATTAKQHLPNYGVFDEFRHFVPGTSTLVLRLGGADVAVAICEDIWRSTGPVTDAAAIGAGLLVVLNASPYERDKDDVRLGLCRARATEAGCTLAYVNLVGGQDELVFDGDSLVVSADGELLGRSPQFTPDVLVVDVNVPRAEAEADADADADAGSRPDGSAVVTRVELPLEVQALPPSDPAHVAPRTSAEEELYSALTLAVRDYAEKNGFETMLLGLSGGIDSALCATIAADAIGSENVFGVSMPSAHSSDHSRTDAEELAERIGMNYLSVPIASMIEAFAGALTFEGLAAENLQARVRGMVLMTLSNQEGHLVLATGNKSELAVGYSTIYGDAVGGFAPLKDVPKTWVWRLARWRNAAAESMGTTPPIPDSSIDKPPSAELRPGQLDTDSLPPYELLDDLLDDYVEQDRSAGDLVRDGFAPELVEDVLRKVDHAEHKRRQYPPGPKVSRRAFGRDRRLPITNAWRETAPEAPEG